jgi:DNA-binding CsgD family transcriptional regulator
MPRDQTPPPASFATADNAAVLLQCVLNQIDHGILVLRADGSVLVANQVALHECGQHAALHWQGSCLAAKTRVDAERLQRALLAASRGTRTLMVFSASAQVAAPAGLAASVASAGSAESLAKPTPLPLVVLPLQAAYGSNPGPSAEPLVLVLLAKRHGSEPLNVDLFAQAHQLTATECAVLKGLSAGLAPADLARRQGVALSTLRTQIGSIRSKTQTRSIREMLNLVHNLPPVVSTLAPLWAPALQASQASLPGQIKVLGAATGHRPGHGVSSACVPAPAPTLAALGS